VNVCRNESAGLVGMEIKESKKSLKTLERVKRSGSEFPFEFSYAYQCLRTFGQFLCWTLCWTFYWTPLSPPNQLALPR
jgi:hypothetical protein